MKTKLLAAIVLAGGILLFAAPIFAHHAEVVYDMGRLINLTGTVTKFELINPHGIIQFDVKDEAGNVVSWIAELGPPQMYIRTGWNRNTIKPGDVISISSHPHKEGIHRVRFEKLVVNGKTLKGSADGGDNYGQ